MYTGWRVPASRQFIRDGNWPREVGSDTETCGCGKPAYRRMAGPGQGRYSWVCEAFYITAAYGAKPHPHIQPERP